MIEHGNDLRNRHRLLFASSIDSKFGRPKCPAQLLSANADGNLTESMAR